MDDHSTLGDPSPFSLAQTDLIIQLGSTQGHINRWILENTEFLEQSSNFGSMSPIRVPFTTRNFKDGGIFGLAGKVNKNSVAGNKVDVSIHR
jgi:hypothetical protein